MTDVKNVSKKTGNCFVAYLDIMGFSRKVRENLYAANIDLDNFLFATEFFKENADGISLSVFSDSVFVFTKQDNVESVNNFLTYLSCLILSSFSEQIPLKGAISYGQVIIDEDRNKFLGVPIIDAYKLHNKLFYFGVVIDDKAYKRIQELKQVDHYNLFRQLTPIKPDKRDDKDIIITRIEYQLHYNLNWPLPYKPEDKKSIELLDCTNSNEAQIYKKNTLEFIEQSFEFKNTISIIRRLQGK